ncbi:MAG: dTDP-glucose 4,6-dehydratase [Deltaproteobacteria bacterium RBG_16_54_11]|jgi:dTDP-glucose 4,6-dehydratase|nr:MAG: dTDP-glucose 4,6-dehydratase [Deltaproteobacteria bacterium RBG_16_54_11]
MAKAKTILVTGGCGFIGSNFIHYMLGQYPSYRIINLDKLTYCGNLDNLCEVVQQPNLTFVKGDIADREQVMGLMHDEKVDCIVNFAAESHVDRSIEDPDLFLRTNVLGTQVLLQGARAATVPLFIQISTDEVYGSLGATGLFTETTPLNPNSPYAASKAAADLMVRAYTKTYGLACIITRCSNNYGPYQFPEKLIPLMISNALEDRDLPVYGDGLNVRDWIYVGDHCQALDAVLHRGTVGEIYNIGGASERNNLQVVRTIVETLGKPESLIRFVKDRPGHDRRYAMDFSKLKRELDWQPRVTFEQGIQQTIAWYREHQDWWRRIRTGEYLEYYERMYRNR